MHLLKPTHYTSQKEEIQEEKRLTTRCPDCGSCNIEIVEGGIYHCQANHSGECLECGCAWTID